MTFDRNPKPVQFIQPNVLDRACLSVGKDDGFATEDGRSQPSSSGRTRPPHRLRAAQSARFFQIIPIKMKRAISVRKATLMRAAVKNTSVADRGFMSCLASCEAPGVNHIQARKCFGSKRRRRVMRAAPASEAA